MRVHSNAAVTSSVENYREALQSAEKNHRNGAGGSEILSHITQATDTLLIGVLQEKTRELGMNLEKVGKRMCLVALGGYGRKEMHPQSDIDVMFLFPEDPCREDEQLVSAMLRHLFDARLQIGNVTRDFDTARQMAREDLQSLTAMVEGRLIWGNLQNYEAFYNQISKILAWNGKKLISEKIAERKARLARYGNTINVQEPNLKDSPGGLRDYHHGLWLASFLRGHKVTLAELFRLGMIYNRQYNGLQDALEFLWRLRTELHFFTRKKTNLISMDLQHELAKRLGFKDQENRLAEEILMRDYYRAALVVQEFADHITRQTTPRPMWERWIGRVRRLDLGDGLSLQNNEIDTPWDVHFFENNPQRILDIFVHAVKSRATLTQSAAAAVHENRRLIDEAFRSQEDTVRKVRMILDWPGRIVPVLRIMRRLGILHRLFPEWRGIENLVRNDLIHRYTVDEHTLLALHHLETLHEDTLEFTDERVALWQKGVSREVLRLAVFCHDIGKGSGGDHCEIGSDLADKIASRLLFSEKDRSDIRFLVANHLLLSHTAQRHDLTAPEVVTEFAERIDNKRRLDLLYLLTHVDTKAISEDFLNEWKNHLLVHLYLSTQQVLEGKTLPGPGGESVQERREEVIRTLAKDYPEEFVRKHLELLPDSYARFQPISIIRAHLDLIQQFDGTTPRIGFQAQANQSMLEVFVVARDRVGLFNRMATAIMLENFSIFGARLNTREDGVVCNNILISDLLGGGPVNEMRKQLLRERLQRLLVSEGALPPIPPDRYGPRPKRASFEPKVDIYDDAGGRCSVVDVVAVDRAGLLQAISSAISEMGMNILFARVLTEGSRAVDVFYVTDQDGNKITDPVRREDLKNRIRATL